MRYINLRFTYLHIKKRLQFLLRISTLTCDIDIANLSVSDIPVLDEKGLS